MTSNIQISQNPNGQTSSRRLLHTPSQLARSSLLYLQEIGVISCDSGFCSQRDALDSYLFLIVPRGTGTLTYRGSSYALKPGCIVWINCNHGYSYQSSKDRPLELAWIHCNSIVMRQLYSYFHQRHNSILLHAKELEPFMSVHETLEKILSEKQPNFEYHISLQLHTLVNLVTLFSSDTDGISNAASSISEKGALIKTYIETHFAEKITLDDLSREFCVSKYYMLRSFRNQYGMTIIQYLAACRIQHAKKLLRFSDMQIEAIGRACGIEDVSYFNRLFRSYEGMTAGQFRKQWRS
ncbi:MAG: helix-turn-helix transcriptional regulator [Ruminococcus sp.]|nr:helix-turn-helix transcriptional regulator [Ruminococcus sp.]